VRREGEREDLWVRCSHEHMINLFVCVLGERVSHCYHRDERTVVLNITVGHEGCSY